jgi:ribosomal RNA-processing protein 17
VVFDPADRAEYLTGFRKRKNERRREALLQSEVKARISRLAARKEHREATAQIMEDRGLDHKKMQRAIDVVNDPSKALDDGDSESDADGSASRVAGAVTSSTQTFSDKFTEQNFGSGTVTVSTTFGLGGHAPLWGSVDMANSEEDSEEESAAAALEATASASAAATAKPAEAVRRYKRDGYKVDQASTDPHFARKLKATIDRKMLTIKKRRGGRGRNNCGGKKSKRAKKRG